MQTNSLETQVLNLEDADTTDNYTILETEGAGTYIGCNHSVLHHQGTWWGEGDDMIWIDDDFTQSQSQQGGGKQWPPSMHGTGGEDYFSQGWGMQKNAYPFCGTIIHEEDVPGYQVSYRWHLADPVRFNERVKVTMEHGHGNHLSDDWCTTAYWYQTMENGRAPKLEVCKVEERLVQRAEIVASKNTLQKSDGKNKKDLTELQVENIKQREERFREFVEDRNRWLERRAKDSQERAKKNVEIARDIRARFMEKYGAEGMKK